MEHIDVVTYINLDDRIDRRVHIENELRKFIDSGYLDASKVKRIPGVRMKPGTMGCTQGHINSLQYAMSIGAETALILEDDFEFTHTTPEATDRALRRFFEDPPPLWEMLHLAYNFDQFTRLDAYNPVVSRVLYAKDTSGYIIHRRAMASLTDLLTHSVPRYLATRSGHYVIDSVWSTLMKNGNWYMINDRVGRQHAFTSSISY